MNGKTALKIAGLASALYILPVAGIAQTQIQRGETAQGTGSTMDPSGKSEADKMKGARKDQARSNDATGKDQIQRGEAAQGSGSTSPSTDSNRGAAGMTGSDAKKKQY